jgi:hypothetical protein
MNAQGNNAGGKEDYLDKGKNVDYLRYLTI